ncbi:MAG: succinyldiaminopimelate transaminase [Streptosporangiaceae bacterium]
MTLAQRLPKLNWDLLAPYKAKASKHPGGIIDLSVGTPVDPVPSVVRDALSAAADSPGYPATHGSERLRMAAVGWLRRSHGVTVNPDAVLPVIGTKEFIAWLPTLLGCGPDDTIVCPELAYPTYAAGALLAGARSVATDGLLALGPEQVKLAWVNSPGNPTGRILPCDHLAARVRWARERGTVLASDECYIDLCYGEPGLSVLHPDACDGSHQNLLAVYSLSKRSNLAGYRAGLVTGDPALIAELLEIHRHAGMMVPTPIQAAMTAALDDDTHAAVQRARYATRRDLLWGALESAGWRIDHSEAGLYLWATHPAHDAWASVAVLAEAGILVAPGTFYGRTGNHHIRMALTATDERIRSATTRLSHL